MKLGEIRVKFGMHHGLFLTAAFDKLWAQSRSQENDKQISGKARKTQFDFSSKTESLLGPADVGPPGLSRFWTRRSERIHDFVAGKDWKSRPVHKLVSVSPSGIIREPYKAQNN